MSESIKIGDRVTYADGVVSSTILRQRRGSVTAINKTYAQVMWDTAYDERIKGVYYLSHLRVIPPVDPFVGELSFEV